MPSLREIQDDVKKLHGRTGNEENPINTVSTLLEKTGQLARGALQHEKEGSTSSRKGGISPEEWEETFGDAFLALAGLANQEGIDLEKVVHQRMRKIQAHARLTRTLKDALAYTNGEKQFVFDSPTNWLDQLKLEYPGMPLKIEESATMDERYLTWLAEGKRTTLLRFDANQITIPSGPRMPLYAQDANPPLLLGEIELAGFVVKPFRELNDEDAHMQGFASKLEFVTRVKNLYEKQGIRDESLVSLFHVQGFKPYPPKLEER